MFDNTNCHVALQIVQELAHRTEIYKALRNLPNNNDINYNNTTNSDGRKVANEDSAIEKSVNVSQKRKRDQEKVETNNNNNKAKTIVASDSENRKDENRVVCLTCKLPGDSTTLCFCESCDSAYHLSCLGQLEKVETFC